MKTDQDDEMKIETISTEILLNDDDEKKKKGKKDKRNRDIKVMIS